MAVTIQQLKCFVKMAEVMHYTKAAEQLHVSQPSLSYSISELEKELGLTLFERRKNTTFMTQYGVELLPYARDVLDKVEAVRMKSYELIDSSRGTINLGNIYSISFDFVPRILERFYTNKENCHITVNFLQGVTSILTDKLMDGSLDLIFSGESENSSLQRVHIFTQELKLVLPANHALAAHTEVALEDVQGEGLISLGEGSNISNHIAQCFRGRGLHANFVLSVAECSAMGAFISSNMAVAIAPIVPSFNSNNVRIIPFVQADRELLGRKIYLQWPKDRLLSPITRKFRDFVLHEFSTNRSGLGCLLGENHFYL